MRFQQRLLASLLTASLWLTAEEGAFAARLLTATIHLDGQPVLRSYYQDNGTGDPATVWRYFGKAPLWVETVTKIKADGAEPLQAKLKGVLVIRIQHVDRLIVESKADELSLIRTDPSSEAWFLPAEEVERLARANGIADVPAPTFFQRWSPWLGLIAVVAVVIASTSIWLWVRARRRHRQAMNPA